MPNLLSNALKYTTHGSVTLRLRAIDGRARLTVQDTGVGIPTAALPHVFDRFYRAPESAARSIEGTGIGLALVRELVRALAGDVGVRSEPGAGSTFTVEVPFDGAAAAPATASAEGAATSGAGTAAFVQEVGWHPTTGLHPVVSQISIAADCSWNRGIFRATRSGVPSSNPDRITAKLPQRY